MKIGYSTNEYGTLVSCHRCNTCGRYFTVCPHNRGQHYDDCLADTCASYDESRDVDKMFDGGADIIRLPNAWPPSEECDA